MKKYIFLSLVAVTLCGCGMVPISDVEIDQIAEKVSDAAEAGTQLAKPFLDGYIPGLTNILAVFAGLLSGAGTRVGLKALQKKKAKRR